LAGCLLGRAVGPAVEGPALSSDDFGGFFDGFVGVLFFFGDMASLVVGSGWKFVESAKGLKL
jgi:hypothetical protein